MLPRIMCSLEIHNCCNRLHCNMGKLHELYVYTALLTGAGLNNLIPYNIMNDTCLMGSEYLFLA